MLPAAYKMEPETPRVSGADELDRCIERVAMCDRDAFAVLYRSTSGAVFAYALSVLKNRQDAEDVLHDCYVNIYQTAQAYRSEGKPMAWIMTVTRNLCLHKLRACMEQLGGEERRIFLLHAVAGFKHREIAEFMELPLATVLSKYSRAVKKMRKYLEEAELYD